MMGGVIDWPTFIGVLGGGFSAYVAIKSDLARLHEKCNAAKKSADLANRRIDKHIEAHQ